MTGRAGSYRPPAVPRYRPVAPMRKAAATSMRKLAADMKERHPQLGAHEHIRDAAQALDRNQPDAASRHLTAAIGNMTPQSLRRHGLLLDDDHDTAKRSMDQIHRHLLLVKDIADTQSENNALPRSETTDDLTDKPTARQPFRTALNAPERQNTGKVDPAVAGGKAASQVININPAREPRQIAAASSGDLTVGLIDLAFHFNPLEHRDKSGKWSSALGSVASDHMAYLGRKGSSYSGAQSHLAQAKSALDRGDLKGAAGHFRAAAGATGDLNGGAVSAHLREAADHADNVRSGKEQGSPLGMRMILSPPSAHEERMTAARSTPFQSSAPSLRDRVLGVRNNPSPLDFSAQTPALATVPHPFGKPGGPGLWHQKGMQLPPYIQNIARALLRTGRAKDLGEAIAIAKSSTAKWANGKNTRPEVRAASAATNADWDAKRARAHAHANAQLAAVIELAFNPLQPRGRDGKWSHGAAMAAADRALVRGTRAGQAADARSAMRAPAGSSGHAAELRALAVQADAHEGHNFVSLEGSTEGTASRTATSMAAGALGSGPAGSDTGRALRRAATMIDRGQPSLARAHAGTLRSAAVAERADPAYSRNLAAAADKLGSLPKGRGLAAQPPANAVYRARTAAARQYAAGSSRTALSASQKIAMTQVSQQFSNAGLARRIVELTGTAAGAAQDPRTVIGTFGTGGGTSKNTSSSSGARTTKPGVKPKPGTKPGAKPGAPSAKKTALLKQAAGFRARADALIAQRDGLRKALASAAGKTSKGQTGSKTSSKAATTKSTAPAAKASAATAGTAKTVAGKAKTAAKSTSAAALTSQIVALNTQIVALQNQYRQAIAQAKNA